MYKRQVFNSHSIISTQPRSSTLTQLFQDNRGLQQSLHHSKTTKVFLSHSLFLGNHGFQQSLHYSTTTVFFNSHSIIPRQPRFCFFHRFTGAILIIFFWHSSPLSFSYQSRRFNSFYDIDIELCSYCYLI